MALYTPPSGSMANLWGAQPYTPASGSATNFWPAAERIITVGPTGRDYTSLSAAEAGEQSDLVALGEVCAFVCDAFVDTTGVNVDGWTTDETRYIRIEAAQSHGGVYGASSYRLEVATGAGTSGFLVQEGYTKVTGLCVKVTPGSQLSGWSYYGMRFAGTTGGRGGWDIRNNIVWGDHSGWTLANTNNCYGMYLAVDLTIDNVVANNIVYGFKHPVTVAQGTGIWVVNHASLKTYVYNNTVADCGRCFRDGYGDMVGKNNLAAPVVGGEGFSTNWGTGTDYNASTDATAPGANSRNSQTFTFVNADGADYRLALTDTGARRFGTDLSADSTYPFNEDLQGRVRHSGSWDIGAFQSPEVVTSQIASSGGDYTSLSAWEAGQQRDLVVSNSIAVAECQAFEDTAMVDINGWTTGPDQYIEVRAAEGAEAKMPWNTTTAYRLDVTAGGGTTPIVLREDYARFKRLQVKGTTWNGAIYVTNTSVGHVEIDSCYLWMIVTYGFQTEAGGAGTLLLRNSFVRADSGGYGCGFHSKTVVVQNCTVKPSSGVAIFARGVSVVTCQNVIGYINAFSFLTQESGSLTNYNCLSLDTYADNYGGSGNRANQTVTFVDAAGDDYHLSDLDTGAKGFGTDLSADPTYPFNTDFNGSIRSVPWDIGAFIARSGINRIRLLLGQNQFRISQDPSMGFSVRID